VVRAVAGPGAEAVAAGLLIVSNERHDNLELVLPDASALFGRLIGPPDLTWQGMRLALLQSGEKSNMTRPQKPLRVTTKVEPDGAYRFDSLPGGEYKLRLEPSGVAGAANKLPRGGIVSGNPPPVADLGGELGPVSVVLGRDTERDFDLSGSAPGRLLVTVTVDGRPVTGLEVRACVAGKLK
ncbi:MAG: hypothetical protein GY778_29610, partial [bacterium]|nr:hypothetical protein [bacterium]